MYELEASPPRTKKIEAIDDDDDDDAHKWQELKQEPFLNETGETPVKIRFKISTTGTLVIADIKHLISTAATEMKDKMRQLVGPYMNGASTSDMDADAILRISCHNEFGGQKTQNNAETKQNKLDFP